MRDKNSQIGFVDIPCTDIPSIPEIVRKLNACFDEGVSKPVTWRRQQLRALLRLLEENEKELAKAVHADFGKDAGEFLITEMYPLQYELITAINKLDEWLKPTSAGGGLAFAFDRAMVCKEPLGVVCIISPWNYPVSLLLTPLVSALAAGNCCLLKPSELAPATAALVAALIGRYLDSRAVSVVLGGVPETTALLKEKFDHISFTGSSRVGKVVMKAAAEHLTPVTLELGGKSPCIVDRNVDLSLVSRRVAFGKYTNSGQTCIAVDYLLCFPEQVEPLVEGLRRVVCECYNSKLDASDETAMSAIVNKAHFDRLCRLVADQKQVSDSLVLYGGASDPKTRRIEATAIMLGSLSSLASGQVKHPLMEEEIFGPILPILVIESLEEAVRYIRKCEKPLALYLFTNDADSKDYVLANTASGGVCVNDTMMHYICPNLPFGGVGNSGHGSSHGLYGLSSMSYSRATLVRPLSYISEMSNMTRYPPLVPAKLSLTKKFTVPTMNTFQSKFVKNFAKSTVLAIGIYYLSKFIVPFVKDYMSIN